MNQGFIISGSITLVCLLAVPVGILPAIRASTKLVSSIRQLEKELLALHTKIEILTSLDETTLQNDLNILTSGLPIEKSLPSMIMTIEELAAKEGIGLTSLTMESGGQISTESAKRQSADEQKLGVNKLTIGISIEGTPEQVRNFIGNAHRVRRLMRISNFDFVLRGAVTALQSNILLDVFYAPLPKFIGRAEDPIQPIQAEEQTILNNIAQYTVLVAESESMTSGEIPTSPQTETPFVP